MRTAHPIGYSWQWMSELVDSQQPEKPKRWPHILAAGGLVTGIGLLFVTLGTGDDQALEYFKEVHEVLQEPSRWDGKRVRLHGNVIKGTIQKKATSLDYRFAVFSQGKWLDVTYSGIVPDTFKDCAEVVVKGTLRRQWSVATAI